MMTLDELLALLPDNTSGEISPADLRAVVTDLYDAAHVGKSQYAYDWSTDLTPGNGKLSTDQGWTDTATVLHLAELSGDDMAFGFVLIDRGQAEGVLLSAPGRSLNAAVTGPSVDQGTYRDVPIQVREVAGAEPGNGDLVTVTVVASV